MTHLAMAAYAAAGIGAGLCGLFLAVAAGDRLLEEPHGMDYRATGLLAMGSLGSGLLFALLGGGWLASRLGVSLGVAVGLTAVALSLFALLVGAALTLPVHWYLRWARTPAVLRDAGSETDWE